MRSRASALIAVTTALVLLAGCGGSSTVQRGGPAGADSVGGASVIDRAFIRDMTAHHRSAIAMARVARTRGKSPFVKKLASDIIATQTFEIGAMKEADQALAAERINAGDLGLTKEQEAIEHDGTKLEAAKPFDPEFLRQMIHHHEGAIRIAKVEQQRGNSFDMKNLAGQIEETQTQQIAAMRKHLP